jgi:hypothetical protein
MATSQICTICIEPVIDDYHYLPCAHLYHSECINAWFKSNSDQICPICKIPVYIDSHEQLDTYNSHKSLQDAQSTEDSAFLQRVSAGVYDNNTSVSSPYGSDYRHDHLPISNMFNAVYLRYIANIPSNIRTNSTAVHNINCNCRSGRSIQDNSNIEELSREPIQSSSTPLIPFGNVEFANILVGILDNIPDLENIDADVPDLENIDADVPDLIYSDDDVPDLENSDDIFIELDNNVCNIIDLESKTSNADDLVNNIELNELSDNQFNDLELQSNISNFNDLELPNEPSDLEDDNI